jgi:hypothetical protein
MMHPLGRCQRTPQHLLSHENVFEDVAVLTSSWMVRSTNQDITLPRLHVPTALPVRVV